MIEASLFTILEMERSEDTCLSFLFLVFLSRPLVTPSQRRRNVWPSPDKEKRREE